MKKPASVLLCLLGMTLLPLYHSLLGQEFPLLLGASSVLIGWILAMTFRKRGFLFSLVPGILLPWLFLGFAFLMSSLFFRAESYFFILFHTHLTLILPLYYVTFIYFWVSGRWVRTAPYGILFLLIMGGLGMAAFKIAGGKLPLLPTLVVSFLFLLLSVGYLNFTGLVVLPRSRTKPQWWGGGVLLILLLFVSSHLILRSYEEQSVSQGGGILERELMQFSFSNYIQLKSEISMSDDLVLLFKKEGPAERLLLRRYVLEYYTQKKGFFRDKDEVSVVPNGGIVFPDPAYTEREEVMQEYYLVNLNPSAALGLNYPVEIIPLQKWDKSSFVRIYKTRSMVSQARYWQFRERDEANREILDDHYYDFGGREDMATLARDIVEGKETRIDQVRAIESYLKSNYYYSLKPGISSDGDQLGHFLFTSGKGYCSYFAFAMTLLCRSVDIPSRVAVGFWVDPQSEKLNFYPVSANQAHAWVEVYYDDLGWIEYDPTSGSMAPGEDYQQGQLDMEKYSSLIEEIVRNRNSLIPEEGRPPATASMLKQWTERIKRARFSLGLTLLALYLLWVILSRHLPFKGRADTRGYIKSSYWVILKELYRMAYHKKRGETVLDYSHRLKSVSSINLIPLTQIYLKAEFGEDLTERDLSRFLESHKVYKQERKDIPLGRKTISLLYPFPQVRRPL